MSTQTKRLLERWTGYIALFIIYIGIFTLTLITIERVLDGKQSNTTFPQESSVSKS